MPRRRYRWSHPTHSTYVLNDERVRTPIRAVVVLKENARHSRTAPRWVYEWRLTVAGVDCGVFASLTAIETALPRYVAELMPRPA